jgi:hypothetical protein
MGSNHSQQNNENGNHSQQNNENVSMEEMLGKALKPVHEAYKQKKKDDQEKDYTDHNKTFIQVAGGHGRSINNDGKQIYDAHRFAFSKRKVSKRKVSKRKVSKRKVSKRKVSKRKL